jgi:hypothetical protein
VSREPFRSRSDTVGTANIESRAVPATHMRREIMPDTSRSQAASSDGTTAGAVPSRNGRSSVTPVNPRRTYEALGRFIERRSPYEKVILPDFGPGSLPGDDEAFKVVDEQIPESVKDKHVLIERGRYKEFHQGKPSTERSEILEQQNPNPFMQWDLGDGVQRNVVKEVQIHMKHTRTVDGRKCDATVVVLYLGDAH